MALNKHLQHERPALGVRPKARWAAVLPGGNVSGPRDEGRGVRCVDCRFLRVRERGSLFAPDAAYRVTGATISGPLGAPACLKETCPLESEFERATGSYNERVVEVLWRRRDCPLHEMAAAATGEVDT